MRAWKSQQVFCKAVITTNESQSDKIIALTNAANVELEPIWATLLARALEGKNVKELLSNVGAGGGAPAAAGVPAAAAGGAPAVEAEKEEEKKEEEKEESDEDMVHGFLLTFIVVSHSISSGFRLVRLVAILGRPYKTFFNPLFAVHSIVSQHAISWQLCATRHCAIV